jgi:Asp-tRNA(Asn)/Glu-tRNA(Gln) amidotransferase C subunit
MVVHICNLTLTKPKQEDQEFQTTLGYVIRLVSEIQNIDNNNNKYGPKIHTLHEN